LIVSRGNMVNNTTAEGMRRRENTFATEGSRKERENADEKSNIEDDKREDDREKAKATEEKEKKRTQWEKSSYEWKL